MAHHASTLLAGAALALGLTGCGHAPKMVRIEGSQPVAGTFMFPASSSDDTAKLQSLIGGHLQARGLQHRDGGATYLVQTALARRPATAGAYTPSDKPKWLRAPYRSSSPVSELTVTISDTADGKEIFRASSGRWGKQPLDMKFAADLAADIFTPDSQDGRVTTEAR